MHLRPPTGGAPRVECHRYSPYFFRTGMYIEELRPARWYRSIYPDGIDLEKVAYYFEARWKDVLGEPAYDEVTRLAHAWMDHWTHDAPRLTMQAAAADGLMIEDTRGRETVRWELEARRAWIYLAIRDIASPGKVRATIPELADSFTDDEVRAELDTFVEQGLAIQERGQFLGLALPPTDDRVLAERQGKMRRATNQRPDRLVVRMD